MNEGYVHEGNAIIIAALIAILGIVLKHWIDQKKYKAGNSTFSISLNFATVIRDVGVILLLQAVGGVPLGLAFAPAGGDINFYLLFEVAWYSSICFTIVGFVISGARTTKKRWQHLVKVAIALSVLDLIWILVQLNTFEQWVNTTISTFMMMGIGGIFSYVFNQGSQEIVSQ